MTPILRLAAAVVAAVLVATACSDGDDKDGTAAGPRRTTTTSSATTTAAGDTTTSTMPIHVLPPGSTTTGAPRSTTPAPPPAATPPRVRLVTVGSFESPVAFAADPASDDLFIAEQDGVVRAIRDGQHVDPAPALDLREEITSGGERGLLGLAFAPRPPHHLYVNFTDNDGNTVVAEFAMQDGRAVPSSRRELLLVQQPFANHNGGHLAFDGDGMLWIGLGDGGSAGDPGNRAQRLDTLLGKMLRINPRPSGDRPYTVPPDNPFVGRSGALPEIWAIGLRNPWRYTFDRANGDLWIADVGQGEREEVNFTPAGSRGGQNYGWARMEGTRPFSGTAPDGAIAPVFELTHAEGNCSVTGGYVYRGARVGGLAGFYVFGDYCKGELLALGRAGGASRAHRLGPKVEALSTFGQDNRGELYVVSQRGTVSRIEPA